ncbi:hypothetical protein [Rhodoferax sp.]|uniref:hypothetical protein n=1 Tax=Rhodoferax sp. TaxID=50421 RepID=UPI0025DA282F|nr:hypothetical protein [Rhodoferax sp.]
MTLQLQGSFHNTFRRAQDDIYCDLEFSVKLGHAERHGHRSDSDGLDDGLTATA